MTSKDVLHEIQLQIYDAFKFQDPELFDVVFEVEGKKLYADKFRLSIISSTFKSMLSDRWISKNDPIKIESYTYDDFKEFLSFLYCGKCSLTDENIFAMLDISEFYQVHRLKKLCDEYLLKMEYNFKNIFQFLEISDKYSLIELKKALHDFIRWNFGKFRRDDAFLNAEKIKQIVELKIDIAPEEMFNAVFEWAENQAFKKQKETNDENFNMNDAIKTEMLPFLPFIEFKKMGISFLLEHVVKRGYLFTYDDLSDILKFASSVVNVEVTNSQGQSIYGSLPRGNKAVEVITSLKNHESVNDDDDSIIYWNTKCKIPTTPSLLKNRNGIQWYLVYFHDGDIGVRHSVKIIDYDYLLAEMNCETSFEITSDCKIKIE